ncbi:hypothetical protein ACTHR6_17890 [Ralstonia holmesii]|uniref:hypothetical protein n=1 Tax=Ralstonia TaxID=48736 RepID=UPI00046A5963|nr:MULTISPECIES: hypothetical protein [Ralstonia]CAJ0683294.1 hypothetical protein R11007_00057 [Ralstonia sp. LMG 32967]
MPQTRQNIRRSAIGSAAVAIGLTVVALPHPAHGKLPPPTPAEQAAAAKQAETERAQKAQEQAQLTEVQDRLAARFGKGGNNAPDAVTPATNLPKNVAEAPGTAGPHGGSRPSAESHSGNAR